MPQVNTTDLRNSSYADSFQPCAGDTSYAQ